MIWKTCPAIALLDLALQVTKNNIQNELNLLANTEKARQLSRFFKTGKGEYGEGDLFLGINVPEQRKIAKTSKDAPFPEIKQLVYSRYHEHRLSGFLILVYKIEHCPELLEKAYRFYLQHKKQANNWDIIDTTAPHIIGRYVFNNDKRILFELAESSSLWDKRLAVLASFYFIRNGQYDTTLQLAEKLLYDKHDLIHKAVGWMLREIGNRDAGTAEQFLKKHHRYMPRTMLRYAIEKLPDVKRKFYLNKKVILR